MSWASSVAATQLTSVTTEQFFSLSGANLVTLNPGETAHLQVKIDFPASPTDYATISAYSTVDGTNYDITPFYTFNLDKATDPNSAAFLISVVYGFKVGVKRSGSTDTLTSADATLRKDGISI